MQKSESCLCLCRFSYLQKHTAEHIINLREECWQPLIYYRASLLAVVEGEDAVSYVSSDRKANPPNRSPFSKQKREGKTAQLSGAQSDVLTFISCFRCILYRFQEASRPARLALLIPKSAKDANRATVQGEARKRFQTSYKASLT